MGFSLVIKTPNGLSLIGIEEIQMGFSLVIKTPNGLSLIGIHGI
jgi:hypothetical protein